MKKIIFVFLLLTPIFSPLYTYGNNEIITIKKAFLNENEIGFFRHACIKNSQYALYLDIFGNAEIIQIKNPNGKSLKCDSASYSILKEIPVKFRSANKDTSARIRIFEVDVHKFLLITNESFSDQFFNLDNKPSGHRTSLIQSFD